MEHPVVIAVVGLIGSGKSEATARFVERGFFRVGFNDVIYEECDRLGLEHAEKNERTVRENLRKEFGMGVAATKKLPLVKKAMGEGNNVVIESLYSWDEYKITKEALGEQFKTLAIYAPPPVRYERLRVRNVRPLTNKEARSRDYAEIEISDKAGPIAMADWTIQNTGTREEFFEAIDSVINEVVRAQTPLYKL